MDEQIIETKVIARIHSEFPTKFGIPRQSGLVPSLRARIVFEPEYRNAEALRGIEEFSHLWLIWGFSEVQQECWSPTVRPPRLGGNRRMGVFATRSPFRPNPIGLSLVEIVSVETETPDGPVIIVKGADLMNGTPILDIKPYIVYADSRPDAVSGFASDGPDTHKLTVTGTENLPSDITDTDRDAIIAILSADPRPAYQRDSSRTYGLSYGDHNIRFQVTDTTLIIEA